METLESFLSENQQIVMPVEFDASAALNGGTDSDTSTLGGDCLPHHSPILHGPIIERKG